MAAASRCSRSSSSASARRAWSPRWACRSGLTAGRDHVEGHDRAEEALGARPPHDGQDRRVGDHRARLRLRRVRLDGVDRAPRRRRVRAQRLARRSSPTAPTPTRSCSSASSTRATRPRSARSCSSCSTRACPASSSRSRCARWACTRRRPAMLFLDDVRVGRDRLLGESEEAFGGAAARRRRRRSSMERSGVAAMALGIIERCLELSVEYAKTACSSASRSASSS